ATAVSGASTSSSWRPATAKNAPMSSPCWPTRASSPFPASRWANASKVTTAVAHRLSQKADCCKPPMRLKRAQAWHLSGSRRVLAVAQDTLVQLGFRGALNRDQQIGPDTGQIEPPHQFLLHLDHQVGRGFRVRQGPVETTGIRQRQHLCQRAETMAAGVGIYA